MIAGNPNAADLTTFAVFLPTPGKAVSASIVSGTIPPCLSINKPAVSRRWADFDLKNPHGCTIASSSNGSAPAKVRGVGHLANRAGVVRLTMSSVHWAERITATSSSNGFPYTRSGFGLG